MNKYLVEIPYDYIQYGLLSCYVYAENEEEAEELACDVGNRHEEEFNDRDGGDTDYDYGNMSINIEAEDVEPLTPNNRRNNPTSSSEPNHCPYFLNEINQI